MLLDFLLLAGSDRKPKRFLRRRIRENPTRFRSETVKSKRSNDTKTLQSFLISPQSRTLCFPFLHLLKKSVQHFFWVQRLSMSSQGSNSSLEMASTEYSYPMEGASSIMSTASIAASTAGSINDVLHRASSQGLLSNLRINKSPAPCAVNQILVLEYDHAHTLYEHFHRIGEGVFARVYRAQRKYPQRQVALKVFTVKHSLCWLSSSLSSPITSLPTVPRRESAKKPKHWAVVL